MTPSLDAQREALLEKVRHSLATSEKRTSRLRRTNAWLIYTSLVASALATVVAGLAAAGGPVAGTGPSAWKVTCGAVAVLTGFAGVFTGIHQRLDVPDRLARALACTGKLRGLELALSVTGRDVHEVAAEYQEVVTTNQDFLLA